MWVCARINWFKVYTFTHCVCISVRCAVVGPVHKMALDTNPGSQEAALINGLVQFVSAPNELRLTTAGSPYFVHFKTRHLFLRFIFFEGKKPTLFTHHINHCRAGLQNINTKSTQTGINVNQTCCPFGRPRAFGFYKSTNFSSSSVNFSVKWVLFPFVTLRQVS